MYENFSPVVGFTIFLISSVASIILMFIQIRQGMIEIRKQTESNAPERSNIGSYAIIEALEGFGL